MATHKSILEMVTEFPMTIWIYSEEDGGFSIQSARLATCFASGDTLKQALNNFKFAMFDYFDVPLAKQDTNLVSYKFIELPDASNPESVSEVNINVEQLVGRA